MSLSQTFTVTPNLVIQGAVDVCEMCVSLGQGGFYRELLSKFLENSFTLGHGYKAGAAGMPERELILPLASREFPFFEVGLAGLRG